MWFLWCHNANHWPSELTAIWETAWVTIGFGWNPTGAPQGTPAVLEVRARDVPFLVEDGQVFFRLRFSRTGGRPARIYGEGREASSYRNQGLALGRMFRRDGVAS